MTPPPVALVHDYLTQYGGGERVALAMLDAFPGAPLYTSLYAPDETFPEFAGADVRTQPINRVALLRSHHRLALPLFALTFGRTVVDAAVTLCSSSGWSHGVVATGRKVVYCHTPARWLYQGDRYLGGDTGRGSRLVLRALAPPLRRWDLRRAAGADRYLVNSTAVRHRVRDIYHRDADVVYPPPALGPDHPRREVAGVEAGYWLCVSRLLPYKNVDAVAAAFAEVPGERLVVVGTGPQGDRLRASAPPNVTYLGWVDDEELAWLYAHARAVVAASHEDYGLTPVEGAAFGLPAAVLAWGGFLDTVQSELNGLAFAEPTPGAIAETVRRVARHRWSAAAITAHAAGFGAAQFAQRLRAIVAEEAALA